MLHVEGKYLVATPDHEVILSDDAIDGIYWTNTESMFLSCKVRFERVFLEAIEDEDVTRDGESIRIRTVPDREHKETSVHQRWRLTIKEDD